MLEYNRSMQTFMLQMARIIECSETNTHLLPEILFSVISGVNASISSWVIKFEPPPAAIWLKATHKIVYHMIPFAMT